MDTKQWMKVALDSGGQSNQSRRGLRNTLQVRAPVQRGYLISPKVHHRRNCTLSLRQSAAHAAAVLCTESERKAGGQDFHQHASWQGVNGPTRNR